MAEGSGGDEDLAAGDFSPWLRSARKAIRGEGTSDVPCGSCTACCTSSQFVHIGPDEAATLVRIPAELLFPAPGRPPGHVLLGYDERGHCPMLRDGACSIYDDRPRTCRTYDCRIFPAADVDVDVDDGEDKVQIGLRARRWRFGFPAPGDATEQAAVRAAARFLVEHRASLGGAVASTSATRLAVLAIEVHEAFLGLDDQTGEVTVVAPDPQVVRGLLGDRG